MTTELPAGWVEATVGDLGEYINGRGFKKSEWSDAGRPIIRIQNLTGSGSAFNHFAGELEDRYVVPPGALLISWAATLGVYRWSGPEGALNQHIFKVHSYVNEEFHRYALQHALDLMQADTHGSGMVHITRGRFDSTPVPLPPLAEQKRIVTAIEEAFSKLDAGEAGLRTVRQLLKRMRDAVLAAAVTGRLVPQDPADTPATKLLADLGVRPIDDAGLGAAPPGWAWASIESVAASDRNALAIGPFGSNLKVADYVEEGVPLVFVRNIRRRDFRSNLKFVSPAKAEELASHRVNSGDVLVTKMGDPPGDSAVFTEIQPAIITADCIKISCGPAVNPEYLAWAITTGESRRRLLGITRGVAQKKVSLSRFRTLPVPVPPSEEQGLIVSELDRQFSFIEACEREVNAGLARAAALQRSVLKAAFQGRLVAQDPTDEPASVLLERIRAERAASRPSGGRGRTGRARPAPELCDTSSVQSEA